MSLHWKALLYSFIKTMWGGVLIEEGTLREIIHVETYRLASAILKKMIIRTTNGIYTIEYLMVWGLKN